MSCKPSLRKDPAERDPKTAHSTKIIPVNERLKGVDDEDPSARLTWKDLWVTITTTRGERQEILHGLTGYAEPGAIMAIMGPSGSGKSTLLDSLADRLAKNATLSGDILINGRRKTLSYGTAAYVTQQDVLVGTLTVRESIRYSADLRLPRSTPNTARTAIVERVLVEMGLQDCADTSIGNWHLRGLSGGEKRRVSIALEILTRPRVLFLDEPTSGLDSASAFFVITTLRNLARDGRTVIASIHQPSSEVFELFDMLCLLSNGKTVYFGEARSANEFFSSVGFPCPALRNPSDHFLRAINADFDLVKQTIDVSFKSEAEDLESQQDSLDRMSTTEMVQILVDSYRKSDYAMRTAARVQDISQVKGTVVECAGSLAGFGMQAYTLTRRSFVNMSRDIGYYWLRLIIYSILCICIGSIFFKVGTSFTSITGRAGCLSFVVGFLTFMSIGGFPSFVEDMKVFSRERLNGHYGVAAFVIGNTLSSVPFLFLISIVSSSIVYFMVGLHPGVVHFIYFVLLLFASLACVESLMMVVASIIFPNFLLGIILGAGIQGVYILTSGFFRLPYDIPKPVWHYPLSYFSLNMYGIQGFYQNDFLGLEFTNMEIDGVVVGSPLKGEDILRNTYQIDLARSKWVDLTILMGMIVVYRLLFFLIIKFSEKVQPYLRVLMMKYSPCRCVGHSRHPR
ncbi:hypothetical protein R1flu_012429 [Riccia fluitans]|uniref:ABC transporter domain-containing protein n=1 Tax=Riccia fluitans TaxID=41844 RepID=A0ABD1ZDY3_9MARC